jgi:hypothetical protein
MMIIRTTIFDFYKEKYINLTDLAHSMGVSVSQIYRVRSGKRKINQKFIIGAKKAFPEYRFDDLFYLDAGPPPVNTINNNTRPRSFLGRQLVAQAEYIEE